MRALNLRRRVVSAAAVLTFILRVYQSQHGGWNSGLAPGTSTLTTSHQLLVTNRRCLRHYKIIYIPQLSTLWSIQ